MSVIRTIQHVIAVIVVVLISACGGGGNSSAEIAEDFMGLSGTYTCQVEYSKNHDANSKTLVVSTASNEIKLKNIVEISLARWVKDSNAFPMYTDAKTNLFSTVISFKVDRTLYYVMGTITNLDALSLVAENVWNCSKVN